MTVLDYFVLIVVAASFVSGATKGILKGIITVLSALAGLVIAAYCYRYAAIGFSVFVSNEVAANLLGFLSILILILIAGALVTRLLHRGLKRVKLNWVDRLLGATFGLVRGWLICSGIYLALTAFPIDIGAVKEARFAPVLIEGTKVIAYILSPGLRDRFLSGYETVKELWEKNQ
jgi:membrane protein required for colicin V production